MSDDELIAILYTIRVTAKDKHVGMASDSIMKLCIKDVQYIREHLHRLETEIDRDK